MFLKYDKKLLQKSLLSYDKNTQKNTKKLLEKLVN